MAYQPNWVTKVIFIPISEMANIGGNDYELSADSFWREIRRLEWDFSEGLWADTILRHNNTRVIAGTTYVQENEIINGYQVLLDPLAEKVFLKGDNNNIVDVVIFNGVSVIPSNSAGNTVTEVSGNVTIEDCDHIVDLVGEIEIPKITGELVKISLEGDCSNDLFGNVETNKIGGDCFTKITGTLGC